VSVERGIDPRGFTLVAGGGAGGLHAVGLARELGMRSVMIPREAGTLCSFGMIVTDVRLDETATAHALSDSGDFAAADVALAGMEQRVRERLRANGIKDEAVTIERYVDARYPGQVHELTIRFPDDTGGGAKEYVPGIARSFHDEHKQQFTYSRPEMSVEFLHWRVVGIGRMAFAPKSVGTKMSGDRLGALREKREAYSVVAGRMVPMDIYDAQKLSAGATVPGPAVLEVPTTTILVDEGDTLVVRSDGGFEIAVAVRP
jgi:N-methylhydantoinase A